jgi:hypothetical protein
MKFHPEEVNSWPAFRPGITGHDVARSRDRSTAVVGGRGPFESEFIGIKEFNELPKGLYGSPRASVLAAIDRRYHSNNLIIPDLSNDPTYAEVLYRTFGRRVIGLHIGRYGDGMYAEPRPVADAAIPVYTIGRSYLLELLHSELQIQRVRFANGEDSRRMYQQLVDLQVDFRDTGIVYECVSGHHDDLAIACAMVVWAARHPHLPSWTHNVERRRIIPQRRMTVSAKGWT